MNFTEVIHWLVTFLPTFYLLFKGSSKYYDLIIAVQLLTAFHWIFFKGECIISYFHKKMDDCSYKLGDSSEPTDLLSNNFKKNILIISQIFLFLTGLYMSKNLNYNILLYVIIQFIAVMPVMFRIDRSIFIDVLMNVLILVFLKDNQYLVPGLLLIVIGSCIVKYKDQNSCISGTQVPDDEIDFKPLK